MQETIGVLNLIKGEKTSKTVHQDMVVMNKYSFWINTFLLVLGSIILGFAMAMAIN